MLLVSPTKKNKITLEDYPYQRDIENRLIMSEFTVFEVEVLEEILNSSLRVPIEELEDMLEVDKELIIPVIEKLEEIGLLKRKDDELFIDKEMRKYYEFQVLKFDDNFKPGMEFLLALLKKVPIQTIPIWYSIPRTSDNIFESLVEKTFETPQKFERYLQELCFEDAILVGMIEDVYNSPDLKIRSRTLRDKYNLSRTEFEYYMLHLEFNFVCCLSYNVIGDHWKEVVQPFYEWKTFLQGKKYLVPPSVEDQEGVVVDFKQSFSYVKQARVLVDYVVDKSLDLESPNKEDRRILTEKSFKELFKAQPEVFTVWENNSYEDQCLFFNLMIQKLEALRLVNVEENKLELGRDFPDWEEFNEEEFALHLYRHPGNRLLTVDVPKQWSNFRFYHEVEKSLELLPREKWVLFDEFLPGVQAAVGSAEGVTLCQKGKNWSYDLPTYTEEEKDFIFATIFERLFEVGVINKGLSDGKPCFCITSFGFQAMGLED
jgi:predicted transcriptional regulator